MRKVLQWLQKVIGKWHLKEWKIPKDIQTEKKPEKSNTPEKRFLLQRLGLLWQKNLVQEKTQEIKQLLKEFGADKLSSVPEERYEELMKRAEVL